MRTCHCSSVVSQTAGTGATPRLRLTHYSCTHHSTALSAAHLSPIASSGAAHIYPSTGTHGLSHIVPAATTCTITDQPTGGPAYAHPAWDSAITTPHTSQAIAVTWTCGMLNPTPSQSTTLLELWLLPSIQPEPQPWSILLLQLPQPWHGPMASSWTTAFQPGPQQIYTSHYFWFRALPFGLATSPYLFTCLVKAVGAFSRGQGLSLLQYLDNWNILAPTAPACIAWTSWFLSLSKQLSLVVSLAKCNLVLSRRFVFVGIDFDLASGTARPAPHWVQNLLLSLQAFSMLRAPPAVRWKQLLSHITSLEKLTQQGHLHMHPLQFTLYDNWDQSSDHPFTPVPMPQDVHTALQWWMSPHNML